MLNRVIFLCVNPRECFLASAFQSHAKDYYEWFKKFLNLKNVKMDCKEYIELYGTAKKDEIEYLFQENNGKLQLLYVQTDRRDILERIFQKENLVIMGLPGSKKEFEKMYLSIFPWKNEILFLWGSHIGKDETYIRKLSRECMLTEAQFFEFEKWKKNLEIKKLPPYLREPVIIL